MRGEPAGTIVRPRLWCVGVLDWSEPVVVRDSNREALF